MFFIQIFILMLMSSGSFAVDLFFSRDITQNEKELITETGRIISPVATNSPEHLTLVNQIGFTHPENSIIRHTKAFNHRQYFDVTYHTGNFGLRKIDEKFLNMQAPFHFILAGDSFIFGDGVSDGQTVGAKISKQLKNYHLTNFGVSGGAPNNTLALMENYPWYEGIREKEGIFVYNLELGYMLQRVAGSKSFLDWNEGNAPYYGINSEGIIEREGNFNDRIIISTFYRFLNSVKWLSDLIPDLPRIGPSHARVVTGLFKKMKALYLARFPQGKFIVSIGATTYSSNKKLRGIIREMFRKEEIDFIEFTPKEALDEEVLLPDFDQHYNELGYTRMASEFIEKLQKLKFLHK